MQKFLNKSYIKTIGTSISMESPKLLLYPSISVCSINDNVLPYFTDGKLYESGEAYLNFLDTNIMTPYALASSPNLTEIIDAVNILDTNGTMHVMSPISSDGQNRDFI